MENVRGSLPQQQQLTPQQLVCHGTNACIPCWRLQTRHRQRSVDTRLHRPGRHGWEPARPLAAGPPHADERAPSCSGRSWMPAAAAARRSVPLVPTTTPTSAVTRAARSFAESPTYTQRCRARPAGRSARARQARASQASLSAADCTRLHSDTVSNGVVVTGRVCPAGGSARAREACASQGLPSAADCRRPCARAPGWGLHCVSRPPGQAWIPKHCALCLLARHACATARWQGQPS